MARGLHKKRGDTTSDSQAVLFLSTKGVDVMGQKRALKGLNAPKDAEARARAGAGAGAAEADAMHALVHDLDVEKYLLRQHHLLLQSAVDEASHMVSPHTHCYAHSLALIHAFFFPSHTLTC